MVNEETVYCPLCGKYVSLDTGKCPVCGAKLNMIIARREIDKIVEKRIMRKLGSAQQRDSYRQDEYLKTVLPEVSPKCPACALDLSGKESKCPRCGITVGGVEKMLECPKCGAPSMPSAEVCISCGASFAEEVALAPVLPQAVSAAETQLPSINEKASSSPAMVRPKIPAPLQYPSRGLTNGGGAINGRGLVNGTGLTNGTMSEERILVRGSKSRTVMWRWQFLAVLVAVTVVISAFIYLSYSNGNESMIDGDFGEWAHVAKFGMQAPATLPEVSVDEWAVKSDSNTLLLYLKTASDVLGTSNVDSFFLFVDSDGKSSSGYYVSGIGADYMLELHGWDQKVESASLMRFGSTDDQSNWTSWSSIDSLSVAIKAERMEAMANLPVPLAANSRYVLLAQDNLVNRASSISYPVPEKGGALIIEQVSGPGVDTLTGLIPSSNSVTAARLVLKCEGASGTVQSISPEVVGASLVSQIVGISLSPGGSETVDLVIDSSSAAPQSLFSAMVVPAGVSSTFSEVVIIGEPVSAYVSAPPTSIQIDGAFGDWIGHIALDNDSESIANPNINMTAVGSVNTTAHAAFYVSVKGQAFQGTYVPVTRGKPTNQGGGGGPVIPQRRTGEDVLRIYIDTDFLNSTGELIQRSGKVIGADYLLEIKGISGAVVSRALMSFSSGLWTTVSTTITAAVDSQQIEVSVISAGIGGATSFAAIVETTDWRARSDWAWTGSVLDPWVIDVHGNTYMSSDGSAWNYLGTPALEPGDRVVDIAVNIGAHGGDIFLVTNTGRTYYWIPGTSTEWTAGETNPIDVAVYSEAVSMSFYQNSGAWLLTKNGSYFWLMDAHKSIKKWTYQDVAAAGVTDFLDLEYSGGTMYALRSGKNTSLSYSSNGNSFTSLTSPTRSTSNHTQFTYIEGGSGSADDKIYVLCENGNIRYSSNGGQTWSALGNLPEPTGGNTTTYVGLGFDPAGYLWVVTDTGYNYRSTDTTTLNSFTCMGRAPIGEIVAILPTTVVIPEFPTLMVPVLGMVLFAGILRIRLRRTRNV